MSGILIAILGLTSGIIASLNRGRPLDPTILVGLTMLGAIPSFVGAIVLIAIFAVGLGWLPTFGSGSGFAELVYHLALIALVFVVLVGKVTRSSMVEQLGCEHIDVATSRGMRRARVIRRHVSRNAIGPSLMVSAPLEAGMVQMGVSRQCEYLAEATGAMTTGQPEALAHALLKLEAYGRPMFRQNSSMAHLWIADPPKPSLMDRLFSTHPPIADRVGRLRTMGGPF